MKYEENDEYYTEIGYEEVEYTEYHTIWRRKKYEIDRKIVGYGEREI